MCQLPNFVFVDCLLKLGNLINTVIIMLGTFKYFLFLTHALILISSVSLQTSFNYDYLLVHEEALIAQPIFIHPPPIPTSRHRTSRPTLIEQSLLKKYELRDTNYRPQDQQLSYEDQNLLFSMEPPTAIFPSEPIIIENYRLLELRKFKIEFPNPSFRLKIVITQISTDRTELRHERSTFPITIHPSDTHDLNFMFYASQLNPQHFQAIIYFFIEIYDGNILAEQKIYARKVAATITPNHLRLETHIFRNCPRYQTLVIKNYQIVEIGIIIKGDKHYETIEGNSLEGEVRLQPTKSLKVLMEGKSNQLMIQTTRSDNGPPFPTLMVHTACEQPVTIDYFNIGVIPGEKYVFEYPITVSNTRNDNATITAVYLQSTSQTVIFQQMKFTSQIIIPALSKSLQIGLMRILSRRQPEKKSVITIRMKVSTSLDDFWTEQKFYYQEMRSPISAGSRRFIDLTKEQIDSVRFSLKNNLNLPLFLTRFYCDEAFLQLFWNGQRRKLVYPNHSIEQLSLKYIGPTDIPISPQKYIITLEFNGNLIVPIEIVVYDKSLQCLIENQVKKCSQINELYFQFSKGETIKGRQLVIRNWNPEHVSFYSSLPIQQAKQHGLNMTVQVFGPLPGEGAVVRKREDHLDTVLEGNQFMVVDIEIVLITNPADTIYIPMRMITNHQDFEVFITARVQNGTLALIPQVVRIQTSFQRTIQYLNLVSTYSQSYRIKSVTTNLSSLVVAVPPHQDLKANQFVGMTVVYDPFVHQLNATFGDWSISAKQKQFYQFTKSRGFEPIQYAQVTLQTNTNLQAQSTVIIDKSAVPMVVGSQLRDEAQGTRGKRFTLCKRKAKPTRYGQVRQIYEISFEVRNNFPFPMKYKPFLSSEYRYSVIDSYFGQLDKNKDNRKEYALFCYSEKMKSKYRLTPSLVKEVFSLPTAPEEYLLEWATDSSANLKITLVAKFPKNNNLNNIPDSIQFEFLQRLYSRNYRNCLVFQQNYLLASLMMTELPYKILEQEGERAFTDFIKSQKYNIHHATFFHNQIDHHFRHKHYFHPNCLQKPEFSIFSFCQPAKSKVQHVTSGLEKVGQFSDQTYLLAPGQVHKITVQIFNPEDESKIALIMANNVTLFETYLVQIEIKEPRLYVKHDYFSPLYGQLYEEAWGKWEGNNLLPVELYIEDYRLNEDILEGMRTFSLVNQGQSEITIDHVGIDEKFYSCGQKGIQLFGINCGSKLTDARHSQRVKKNIENKYSLQPMGCYNFTVKFIIKFKALPIAKKLISLQGKKFLQHNIYLYDDKGYHFKLILMFRIADAHLIDLLALYNSQITGRSKYGYILISAFSLLLICILLLRIKAEENDPDSKHKEERQRIEDDPYKRMFRLRKLGRILKETTYYDSEINVGSKLQKKGYQKCIHKVTEDLLLSAKEVTQRQLKKYFNQSEESAIGAILEINHHLSLSQSISDHEVLTQQPEYPDQDEQKENSQQSSQKQSSNLPEGEQVDLTDEIDEDSWYDFNRQFNESTNKSNRNISADLGQPDEQEFYNVFRTDVGLKKAVGLPFIMSKSQKKKEQ